ncbi:hypothetical protein A1O3_06683 [Capronia epimyces CBS 606.96]|uniref:Uncharacterized protein n=1 Tax=Capronia epimyces CBS 606.96 TaxID=1182542 RepID=W9XRP8_9EURO|nr:uncharacterized protein A1O3_06683 [Capronia epimyces CBS 606.96]EXJ82868.1 hypothetical protein A1O3_06683 [Capronia epimyces CBS 606.96]
MVSVSPGVTIVLAAIALLFIIFAVWAVYAHLMPYLRHPRSRPVPTTTLPPNTTQPDLKNRRSELTRSLYGTPRLLFQEPRNDISDYDLKNTRYSTHALDYSRPPSFSFPFSAPASSSGKDKEMDKEKYKDRDGDKDRNRDRDNHSSQAGEHSRSRSRSGSHSRSQSRPRPQTRGMADLRTSLYSEPGLLQTDARSSTYNLILDVPDSITSAAPSRPKSRRYDSSTSIKSQTRMPTRSRSRSRSQSQSQRRRSAPLLADVLAQDLSFTMPSSSSQNTSSTDLTPLSPSAHVPVPIVSATTFLTSSRHSLPNMGGYFASVSPMNPSPSLSASTSTKRSRSRSRYASGETTLGSRTPPAGMSARTSTTLSMSMSMSMSMSISSAVPPLPGEIDTKVGVTSGGHEVCRVEESK